MNLINDRVKKDLSKALRARLSDIGSITNGQPTAYTNKRSVYLVEKVAMPDWVVASLDHSKFIELAAVVIENMVRSADAHSGVGARFGEVEYQILFRALEISIKDGLCVFYVRCVTEDTTKPLISDWDVVKMCDLIDEDGA